MSRTKKILTTQTKWFLGLAAGLVLIYVAVHWQDYKPNTAPQILINQDKVDYLSIDSLGIQTPIIYSQSSDEKSIQGELVNGVVHLANTALPGDAGNAYIVGHSSNYKNSPGSYNTVFAPLPQIKVGSQIIITRNLKHYTYVVYETRIVEPTELWVLSQETGGQKILTLQTSYPVGTADKRFIAIAKLKD